MIFKEIDNIRDVGVICHYLNICNSSLYETELRYRSAVMLD